MCAMRTRSQGSPSPVTLLHWSQGNGCSQTSAVNTSVQTYPRGQGSYATMSDVVTPQYFARRRRGDVIMNPYTRRSVNATGAGSGFRIRSKSPSCLSPLMYHDYWAEGFWMGPRIVTDVNLASIAGILSGDEMHDLLVEASTCLENKRGRSPSNLWETVSELGKTRHLLGDVARSMGRVLTKAEKLSKLGSASDVYLALRYGLGPLISDAENIVKSLDKTVGTVRIKQKCERLLFREATTQLTWLHDYVKTTADAKTSERFFVKAITIDETDATRLSRAGFTIKGLVTLPWELTTLSFVADWFFNIGDYLGALAPALGWKQLGSCLSVEHEKKYTVTCTGTHEVAGTYAVLAPNTGTIVLETKEHWRQGTLSPGLVKKSDFGLFDGGLRDADAFTLLGQRVARLGGKNKSR